ncbi:MAG TPA: FkbM family methyltransferase [Candidatus Limnocylindria bacterium]|nr:FkbM family methyltransferase [Candidatus Limnocylindria bacterium]
MGANEGDFIRATTRLANPSAVFAFEPLPSCQPALSKLLASVRGGQLICAAVGAATGEVKLHCTANTYMSSVFPPQRGIDSSYADGDYGVVQQLSVPQVKLDDAIPPGMHIDLLKVDVQGYEMEVLRGATRTLKETGALLIEVNYTPHYKGAVSFDELHAFLNAVGFHLHGISTPYFDDIRPLWADAMYVRKD